MQKKGNVEEKYYCSINCIFLFTFYLLIKLLLRASNFILILLAVCFSYTGYSQSFPNLQFEHITIKEGLSSNVTTCVTEDKNGFIWVGTNNGLNRYDGYRFKAYYHKDDDSNSLINNYIQGLYCDSKNRIWISTIDGLSCFFPDENKFINYSTRFATPYQLENNSIGIYEDAKQDIYITNQRDYIYKIHKSSTLEKIKLGTKTFYGGSVPINGYNTIKRDNTGNEWAIMGKRIYLLNTKTKLITTTYDFENVFPNLDMLNLIQDSNNNYWVSTWMDGIYQFLPEE